jgi:hypothetical protein
MMAFERPKKFKESFLRCSASCAPTAVIAAVVALNVLSAALTPAGA